MARKKRKKRRQKSAVKRQTTSPLQAPLGFNLADMMQEKKGEPPTIDTTKMLWLYQTGRYTDLIQFIISVCAKYETYIFARLQPSAQVEVDNFVFTTLYILARPDFKIPKESFLNFMAAAPILNNMVALSSLQTTDGFLRAVLSQPENFFKVLPLCTARNELQVNVAGLFETNQHLASIWWLQYCSGISGLTNKQTYDNATRILANVPKELILPDWRCTPLYFTATYIDPNTDQIIKRKMNECIQNHIPKFPVKIVNNPVKKRIAIIASRWYKRSAVYKTSEPHITALKKRGYDMDLIHLGSRHVDDILERDDFSNVKYVEIGRSGFNFNEIADNDYEAVYFPDIGMNNESIWLSNMPLAPIKIMGLGHPVSTFGSKIDYLISGAEVEREDLVQVNYSERVVLIPGLGASPVDPEYTRKHAEKADPEFIINCCWTAPKINYPMLQALVEIKKRSKRQVVFHFLPSWTVGRQNSAIPFLRDMKVLFGSDVLITAERPYHEYLEKMESGHLSLVPHPFGGYNTVVDSFAVGLPCVAIEGSKWYNRCGPGLLRRCNFDDLIVDSIEAYVDKVVEIVDNPALWHELVGRLAMVDLQKTLYITEEPSYFADAFDYLLTNHERLQAQDSREPIRIRC